MNTHLQNKRTVRNTNSKRKAALRRRGMSPQWKPLSMSRKAMRKRAELAVNAITLRGVKADLCSTIPKSVTPKRPSLFRRLFSRGR